MSWRAAILIQGKGSNNCLLVTEKQCCKKTVWINEWVNTGLMSYFLCLVDELSGDDDSFSLHSWTQCRVNRVLVSVCCSIDTQPGDKPWDTEGLSTGHRTFISQHQLRTVLLLRVWSAAAAWCFREADWHQRHRWCCSEELVGSFSTAPHRPGWWALRDPD